MDSERKTSQITFMVVGCDHYDNLKALHTVKDDLSRVREIFCKSEYSLYHEENFIEIYDGTSLDLRKAIQDYVYSRSAEQDILLLFFSGHGTAIGRDDFGFCMRDTVIHPENGVVLPTSVVKLSEIVGSLYIKNVSLILFVDACYSGQISKLFAISYPEIFLEMSKSLVAHTGSFFGLVTSCSTHEQIEDIGVLSKALKDICDQGIDENNALLNFSILPDTLTERIDNHSNSDTRSRIFIPPGIISNLPLCRNVQYYEPPEPVNIYSFTKPYLRLLEILWNGGHPISLAPGEILEKTGSQSAYANHNKLSLDHWNLLSTNSQSKRELTPKGIQFLQGDIKIPKTIVVNKDTRVCNPANGCPSLLVGEEKNLFGEVEKVFREVEPFY